MNIKINMRGLGGVLERFDEDGYCAYSKHWKIARGGYDLWFEVYYDNVPIIDCVDGELQNLCLDTDTFYKIATEIVKMYNTNVYHPIRIAQQV